MSEITEGLKPLKTRTGKPALVLVTGATGYIGGRLVTHLLEVGYRVRVFARQADRLRDYPWISKVEVVEGDANDIAALNSALKSVDVAYYMLHALNLTDDFEKEEKEKKKKLYVFNVRLCGVQPSTNRLVLDGPLIAVCGANFVDLPGNQLQCEKTNNKTKKTTDNFFIVIFTPPI